MPKTRFIWQQLITGWKSCWDKVTGGSLRTREARRQIEINSEERE
jgi:hypothetical protein